MIESAIGARAAAARAAACRGGAAPTFLYEFAPDSRSLAAFLELTDRREPGPKDVKPGQKTSSVPKAKVITSSSGLASSFASENCCVGTKLCGFTGQRRLLPEASSPVSFVVCWHGLLRRGTRGSVNLTRRLASARSTADRQSGGCVVSVRTNSDTPPAACPQQRPLGQQAQKLQARPASCSWRKV